MFCETLTNHKLTQSGKALLPNITQLLEWRAQGPLKPLLSGGARAHSAQFSVNQAKISFKTARCPIIARENSLQMPWHCSPHFKLETSSKEIYLTPETKWGPLGGFINIF